MKKLMIAAAAAAMVGGAFAGAQVYDASLSMKLAICKEGKFPQALVGLGFQHQVLDSAALKACHYAEYEKGDKVAFRKKGSATVKGVIWGCDCDAIAYPAWKLSVYNTNASIEGYAFWMASGSTYKPFELPFTFFKWTLLNRIDQMKTIEGTWTLCDQFVQHYADVNGDTDSCGDNPIVNPESFYAMGAGFGTATFTTDTADSCSEDYVKSISGNFAGWRLAPLFQGQIDSDDGCVFCGGTFSTEFYGCLARSFCLCDGLDGTNLSAIYGTWTIKYNSSASKKLNATTTIRNAYKFTGKLANVGTAIEKMEQAVRGAFLNFSTDGKTDMGWVIESKDQVKYLAPYYYYDTYMYDNLTDAEKLELEQKNILNWNILPEQAAKQMADAS